MRVVAGNGERPGTDLGLPGMRQAADRMREAMRQQGIRRMQINRQAPGGDEGHRIDMQQSTVARRVGEQLLHRTQNIVIAQWLAVMPVRAAAQVKMPAQPVVGAGPVVCQIGYRLRLTRFVTR